MNTLSRRIIAFLFIFIIFIAASSVESKAKEAKENRDTSLGTGLPIKNAVAKRTFDEPKPTKTLAKIEKVQPKKDSSKKDDTQKNKDELPEQTVSKNDGTQLNQTTTQHKNEYSEKIPVRPKNKVQKEQQQSVEHHMTVLPQTGEEKTYLMPIGIGVMCLGILILVFYFVKKGSAGTKTRKRK